MLCWKTLCGLNWRVGRIIQAMSPRTGFSIAVVATCLCALTASAVQAEPLRFWRFRLTPTVSYTGSYSDNPGLDSQNAEGGFVNDLGLSLRLRLMPLELNVQRQTLELGFDSNKMSYTTKSLNTSDYYSAFARMTRKLTPRIMASLDEEFTYTDNLEGTTEGFNIGEQTARWTNDFSLSAQYAFHRSFRLQATYANTLQQFQAQAYTWQDYIEHRPEITVFYQILPKTSVLGSYRLTLRTYPEQNTGFTFQDFRIDSDNAEDYFSHSLEFGVQWDATAKLDGSVRAGFSYLDYTNDLDWNGNRYKNNLTWSGRADLSYAYSTKTSVHLQFARDQRASTRRTSNRQTQTGIGLQLRHKLKNNLTLHSGLDLIRYDYENSGRNTRLEEEDRVTWDIELTYNLRKYFSIGLGYSYDARMSDDKENDFDANTVFLRLEATYN